VPLPPADQYRARAEARQATRDALNRQDLRLSQLRLVAFGSAVALGVFAARGALAYWWIALPVAAFILLVTRHDVAIRARDRATRAIQFYERGLARLEDRWIGTGETGERFKDDAHLYANDLDLFGPASLFELLSVARTRPGEEMLARWLKDPAPAAEILVRQDAVRELAPLLDLREALSLAGDDVRAGVEGELARDPDGRARNREPACLSGSAGQAPARTTTR